MGGSDSIRGYLVQTLIALLDALDPDADWHTVMLEGDQSIEKIDLIWFGVASTRATQIKSSKNQISLPDCFEWARELKLSVRADIYELVLVGPCSRAVVKEECIDGVILRPPLNLDVQGLMDQATHRLERYLATRRVVGTSGVARELLLRGLITEFLGFSATKTQLTKQDFDKQINKWVEVVGAKVPESAAFSDSIRREFARINKTIDHLTKDQFNAIKLLRHSPRVRIAGVAGSGKTLVAAEKAMRLERASFRTLLLCHSVHLASYLEQLTFGSGIEVFDFSTWVQRICTENNDDAVAHYDDSYAWTHLNEPTGDQLERALDFLLQMQDKYDAVIVDEGQDFRPEWWTVVEAALKPSDNSMLYIFHDDNQALLPARSAYPIEGTLCDLSKNCRNAGSIFSLVRRFHKQAPEVSAFLEGTGTTRVTVTTPGTGDDLFASAVRDAVEHLPINRIIVVTTEESPASRSVLHGRKVTPAPHWAWRRSINVYLKRMHKSVQEERVRVRSYLLGVSAQQQDAFEEEPPPDVPLLSSGSLPTQEDIRATVEFANATHQSMASLAALPSSVTRGRGRGSHHKARGVSLGRRRQLIWEVVGGELRLTHFDHKEVADEDLIRFFSSSDWVKDLPLPESIEIRATTVNNSLTERTIRLYNAGSVKGLEADGVIVYAHASGHAIRTDLYVAISRARVYLHILLDSAIAARIPQLSSGDEDVI